jgi:diphthine synthase
MAFYLIGTGLDKNSISADAIKILKSCNKIYLENYTINFPFKIEELENSLDIKIEEINRRSVENETIISEANEKNIALLVYGDSLSATTHIQLILACKEKNIEYKIFHNASIMTAVAETGLQPYKFGKTPSMPNWKEHTNKPTSFVKIIEENKSIEAHTLILTDIGLELKDSLNQLEETANIEKIIVLSNAGTKNQKIFYDSPKNLKEKEISMPFCLIIPGKLHFLEEESLEKLKEN